MIFSNYKELATSPLRERVLQWADEGIASVLPEVFIPGAFSWTGDFIVVNGKHVPAKGKRIFVVGAGKASASMAVELEKILGTENITAGVVLSNYTKSALKKIQVHESDHPIPTERSVLGAKKILSLKEEFGIGENDIVIALMSGGGSSLMAYPAEGLTIGDKQKTIEALIRSGGNVHEITVVKKKISQVKGGMLAEHFYPTPVVSLVLSDVVGNNLDVIASGPFTEDFSTFKDALDIIKKRGIEKAIPRTVISFLEKNKDVPACRKSFSHVHQEILADNNTALRRIKSLAEGEGVEVFLTQGTQGEAKEVAYKICSDIHNQKIAIPTLFLYGGETTVTLDYPHKKGGRNQEFILACLNYLNVRPFKSDWCIASVGTDGIDFIEESTGAIIDPESLKSAKEKGLNVSISSFLEKHKTGRFLDSINSNISTNGPTGTNVCDIMMFFLTP